MDGQEEKVAPPKKDTNTELAKERTRDAYDRTFMAWVRTGLSLIGFGIGIFEVADQSAGAHIFRSSKLIGLALVILGIIAVYMAIKENKINHDRLLNPEITYEGKKMLSARVGYALIAIGIVAIILIIKQTFFRS
jgi:putative membrane protein